ncbi:MAG TPA: 3-dehydroquinate synthase [Ignavibacteriaceae bacterium]|nr:3-dehydroquinate synthase [Ignavibacteriaceae bacterium]
MKKINVELDGSSYPVFAGRLVLHQLKQQLKKYTRFKNYFVIIDRNVAKHHFKSIKKAIGRHKKIVYYELKPGENSKSHEQLRKIYESLMNNNFGRDSLVIAVGGGVTGDLAGYSAATYMRGLQLVHIPTTLLSAVDSSIGGKTAINMNGYKNIIGAFYQPDMVMIDTEFLKTLPQKEFISGLGEVIKYAYISSPGLYDLINKNFSRILDRDEKILDEIILKCAAIKAGVVSNDEREEGLRKILNFGHTFGHAIETASGFKIRHGECILYGIVAELYLSNKIGVLSRKKLIKYLELPGKFKFKNNPGNLDFDVVYGKMELDKKNKNGKINFVLLSDLGKILLDIEAGKRDILYAFERTRKFFVR